ncbi:MAG: DsrE family protein [Candidatus Thermoplasmatota archaeon]|jgi:peroxiredoxin family protein|nr:DsrE family protein [Candidatus Thermoplasmatota archaeon]
MKVGIILGTNELSGLMFAAIEAGMRTSMDDSVIIFVTMDGVRAFLKDPEIKKQTKTSEMIAAHDPDFRKYLKEGKESGLLKIYVCYYAAEVYDVDKKDLDGIVDDIWGITKFSIETEDAQIIPIW